MAAIEESPLPGTDEIDAAGGLVTESFVNGHMHLDKVYTLDRIGDAALTAYTSGDMGSALRSIELASAVKDDYDRRWIQRQRSHARCSRRCGTASATCSRSPTSTPGRGWRG